MFDLSWPNEAGQETDPFISAVRKRRRSDALKLSQDEAKSVRVAVRKLKRVFGSFSAVAVATGIPSNTLRRVANPNSTPATYWNVRDPFGHRSQGPRRSVARWQDGRDDADHREASMSRSRVRDRERLRAAVQTTDPAALAALAGLLRPVVEKIRTLAEDAIATPDQRIHSRVFLRREILRSIREIEARLSAVVPQPMA